MNLCDSILCTGCGACAMVCPKGAINLQRSHPGFKYPIVSTEKCVDCHMCERVCPVLHKPEMHIPLHTFAAFTVNSELRASCASGGIGTMLGRALVQRNGVVFGVQQSDGIHTVYASARTVDELAKFQNSKYVESDLGSAYYEVKALLKSGKEILFIGLPCQVAGLLKCISETLRKNLYTVDLICHGTPSAAFFEECIKKEYGATARVISFRNNKAQFFIKVQKNNSTVEYPASADLYYRSFIESYSFRESCYRCQFARETRVSDLTIGDFWGLGMETYYPHDKNKVSLVLQNTEKGQHLLQYIKNDVQIDERTLEKAVMQNTQLIHPSENGELAHRFQTYCQHMSPYEAASRISGKAVRYNKLRYKLSCIKRKVLLRK